MSPNIRRIGLKVPLLRLRMALEAEMEESLLELDVEEQVGSCEAAACRGHRYSGPAVPQRRAFRALIEP